MIDLGVQMFTLRRYTQTEAELVPALAQLHEIGYRSIQVSAFGDIPVQRTAQHCQELGINVRATHTPWPRLLTDLAKVIEEHHVLGCQHTAVGMIPPADYLSLAGLEQFLTEGEQVAKALAAEGISFSYHHHHHEFQWFDGLPWLEHLRLAAPARGIGIELDTHWVAAGAANRKCSSQGRPSNH